MLVGLLPVLALGARAVHLGGGGEHPRAGPPGPCVLRRRAPRALARHALERSDQRVVVWGLDVDSAEIRYHHIAKTGVTSITALLSAGLGPVERIPALLPAPAKQANDFYIASIRNPCNYYVSLWAYSAEHTAAHVRKELAKRGYSRHFFSTSENKSLTQDIRLFREFTKFVQGDIGVYTGRVAYGYVPRVEMQRDFITRGIPHGRCMRVREELSQFNLSQVDCLVSTETLVEDMNVCMVMLAAKYKWPVNWTSYREALKSLHTNPSRHLPCKDYYDEELERIIREKDDIIFEKFGFGSCCDVTSRFAAHRGNHSP